MSAQQQDVSQIKQRLTSRRSALAERYARVSRDLQRDEILHTIDDAARDELAALDEALLCLEQGLYGTCKACGAGIEPGRLQALHAVTCSRCATG